MPDEARAKTRSRFLATTWPASNGPNTVKRLSGPGDHHLRHRVLSGGHGVRPSAMGFRVDLRRAGRTRGAGRPSTYYEQLGRMPSRRGVRGKALKPEIAGCVQLTMARLRGARGCGWWLALNREVIRWPDHII